MLVFMQKEDKKPSSGANALRMSGLLGLILVREVPEGPYVPDDGSRHVSDLGFEWLGDSCDGETRGKRGALPPKEDACTEHKCAH